jgi:hypothetical protein
MITPMHGHMAFRRVRDDRPRDHHIRDAGALRYAPATGARAVPDSGRSAQISGMFGMTMAFAAAGITQTYLERILGLGYLDTQRKMQVHYLMLTAAGILFVCGVGLFLYDFFILAPRRSRRLATWSTDAQPAHA